MSSAWYYLLVYLAIRRAGPGLIKPEATKPRLGPGPARASCPSVAHAKGECGDGWIGVGRQDCGADGGGCQGRPQERFGWVEVAGRSMFQWGFSKQIEKNSDSST